MVRRKKGSTRLRKLSLNRMRVGEVSNISEFAFLQYMVLTALMGLVEDVLSCICLW